MPTERITLKEVRITDFRGFRGDRRFDLGRVTLLLGRNGLGKTTVFDAIDWALFGRASRLGAEEQAVYRNLWKPSPPEVSLIGEGFSLVRSERGATLDGHAYDASDLVTDPSVFNDSRALLAALRGLSYLSQDTLRELAVADPEDRATLLRALTGVPLADTVRTGIKKVFQKVDDSSKEALRARDEAQVRMREVASEIASLEQKRSTEEEPARRAASLLLGDRARSAPLEQVVGSLIVLGQESTQGAGVAAELAARGRSLRERIIGNTSRSTQCAGALRVLREKRQALDTAVAAHVARAEAAETAWSAVRETHRTAVAQSEEVRARKAQVELAYRKSAEARAIRKQLADLTVALTDSTRRSEELNLRSAQLGQASGVARANVTAAAGVLDDLERRGRSYSTVQKAKARVSLMEGQLAEAVSSLQVAARDAEELSRRVAELAAAANLERARVAQAGTSAERIAAIIRELSSLQSPDECECLLCGYKHASPEALHSAINRGLQRTAVRAGDVLRLQTVEQELEAARKASTKATHELERQRARVHSATSAHESARKELASAQAAYGEVEAPAEEDVVGARSHLFAMRQAAKAAEAASRDAAVEFERASGEAARVAGLVRSLDERLRSIGPIPTEDPVLENEISEVASAAQAAAERVAATDAAQRRAANARDDVTDELARARKERDDIDGELRGLERTTEELQVEAVGLLGAARELGVDRARLDEITEALTSFTAAKETEATDAQARAASCSTIVMRMTSLLKTAELPRLNTEMAGLNRTMKDAEALCHRLEVARHRLTELRNSMESAVQQAAEARLDQSDASVNQMLSLLTPHRHLNIVQILRDGTLRIGERGLPSGVDPRPYSSAGQLTCLALSLFLGISVLQAWSKLNLVMLDEPVQHLDDVKFLNFIEMVKRLAQERQIIVSTADRNIGEMLKLKMSRWAVNAGEKIVIHEFVDFDRETGPMLANALGDHASFRAGV